MTPQWRNNHEQHPNPDGLRIGRIDRICILGREEMERVTMPEPVARATVHMHQDRRQFSLAELGTEAVGELTWGEYDLITTDQAEAYAAAKVRETLGWISVDERLPDAGMLVLVYSPPQPDDWPDSIRIEFDFIDPDSDDPIWHNHSEHYEHYCCVAKGGSDVEWTGPSEKATYTHWMPLPAPPSTPA